MLCKWPESPAASPPLNRHMHTSQNVISLLNVLRQFACPLGTLTTESTWQALMVSQYGIWLWLPSLSSFKPCVLYPLLRLHVHSRETNHTQTLALTVLIQPSGPGMLWVLPADCGRVGDVGISCPHFKCPTLEETYIASTLIPLATWCHVCREPACLWWEEDGNCPTLLDGKGPSVSHMPPRRSLEKVSRY